MFPLIHTRSKRWACHTHKCAAQMKGQTRYATSEVVERSSRTGGRGRAESWELGEGSRERVGSWEWEQGG